MQSSAREAIAQRAYSIESLIQSFAFFVAVLRRHKQLSGPSEKYSFRCSDTEWEFLPILLKECSQV
jgi:hypothetical protein